MHKKPLLAMGVVLIIFMLGVSVFSVVTLNSEAEAKPVRVACVGDSITEGSGYPAKLRALLGGNYLVGNFGVSGSTISLNSTNPYMNETKFQAVMDYQPDIVVIMLGTNDANPEIGQNEDRFETDYSQLVTAFEQLEGKQLIWVIKSPPIFANNSSYNNTYLASDLLPQIDTLAEQMNLPTVDMYSALSNHSDYFVDGVHPDSEGASIIASNVYDAITLPDGSPDYSYFSDGYTG
jgi:lysophospholipase L1-like esterase